MTAFIRPFAPTDLDAVLDVTMRAWAPVFPLMQSDIPRYVMDARAQPCMAMVGTGGDRGHAPSRATYESAGFERYPVARYFRKL